MMVGVGWGGEVAQPLLPSLSQCDTDLESKARGTDGIGV